MNTFLRTCALILLVALIFISATGIFCSTDDVTNAFQESNCPIHTHIIQSIKPFTLANIAIHSIGEIKK